MISNLSLIKPKYLGAWLVVFSMWLIAWIPFKWKIKLGRSVGKRLKNMLKGRARVGRINLKACFPDKSDNEIERLLEQCMIQLTIGLLESPHAWWRDMRPFDKKINVLGMDNLLNAQAKGNGVLIMGGHFAAVDFIIPLFAARIVGKYKLGYMYRPNDNPVIDQMIVKGRGRSNVSAFTKNEIKPMMQYLRDGGMVWYGCDQNFSKASDLFVPFFGVPAANISTPSWIVRETDAAVVFMRMHRLDDGRYEFEFTPELPEFGVDPQKDCQRWNQALEKAILQHPGQYFWVHKRFKKRPEGEPKFY